MRKYFGLLTILLVALSTACAPVGTPVLPATVQPSSTIKPTLSPALTTTSTSTPEPTLTSTFTPVPTDTLTPTVTLTPTETATTGPTPTPVKLMGSVLERSNCRYGPGAVFLYKYGLNATAYMQVIGRDQAGTWLLIHSRGGDVDDRCWIKASLMQVEGDVMTVPEVNPDIILPWTSYYPNPLTGVSATRNGSEVTVRWNQLVTKAGDEVMPGTSETLYLIEAWVCKGGKITFTVVGSNTTMAKVPDEPGCSEPSHARVYGADKHGYTPWLQIPWP